jgi:hypothetical protein
VLTTVAGAALLGGETFGRDRWQPVVGFVLAFLDDPGTKIYRSGDTVWYEGVQEVSVRFAVRVALLFRGAAWALAGAAIAPVQFEGWEHV